MEIITLRGLCGEGEECPGVHRVTHCPDLLFVVANLVSDPVVLAALATPETPLVGAVPASLLPEVRGDRDPYPWARVLPDHPDTVFITGSTVADEIAAAMLAARVGDGEFLMTVPDVALVEV